MISARQRAFTRRTQLYVPANRDDFLAKATERGADALILDLEDSIPIEERAHARQRLAGAVQRLRSGQPTHLVVRVNNDENLHSDLAAARAAGVDGVLLPKVEHEDQVAMVDDVLNADRNGDPLELQLLVESSAGILRLPQIAAARTHVVALMLGIEDLSSELEIDPRSENFDLRWAHGMTIAAARATGIAPYGMLRNLADLNPETYAADVRRSREFGYVGTLCIHPVQVPLAAEGFAPTQTELTEAREILDALETARREGHAAVRWRNRMVDTPMITRARRLLSRAGQGDLSDE